MEGHRRHQYQRTTVSDGYRNEYKRVKQTTIQVQHFSYYDINRKEILQSFITRVDDKTCALYTVTVDVLCQERIESARPSYDIRYPCSPRTSPKVSLGKLLQDHLQPLWAHYKSNRKARAAYTAWERGMASTTMHGEGQVRKQCCNVTLTVEGKLTLNAKFIQNIVQKTSKAPTFHKRHSGIHIFTYTTMDLAHYRYDNEITRYYCTAVVFRVYIP